MASNANGLNEGNAPLAIGEYICTGLFPDGSSCYLNFLPTGQVIGSDAGGAAVNGAWSTDHNGLNQPAAAIFLQVFKFVGGVYTRFKGRFGFSQTPIVGTDDARSTSSTFIPNTDNGTLAVTTHKIYGPMIFQLFNEPDQ